jgi:hypothetical protein
VYAVQDLYSAHTGKEWNGCHLYMYRRLETQEYIVPLEVVCVCVYMWTDMMHYFELKEWCGFFVDFHVT